MKSMHELKEMLCEELEMIAKKGNVSHTDLENVYKLTESIKNIMKIDEMDEGMSSRSYGRYNSYNNGSHNDRSYDGNWMARGSYGDDHFDGNFDRDTSGRSRHYVRGHYSYDGGMLEEKIGEMMNDNRLSLDDKSTLKKAMDILKR